MKSIIFVNNSLDHGGAERVLVNLVNFLPSDKYKITLFTLYSSGVYEGLLSDKVQYKFLFKKRGKLFNKIALNVFCRLIPRGLLHKIFIKQKYDFEIAFLQGFPTELVRKSQNKSCKKICFVHSDFSNNYDVSGVYASKDKCLKAYEQFDKVCFVSNTAREGFEKTVGTLSNSRIVHNVMDTENIVQKSKEDLIQGFSKGAFRIVSVGRIISIKAFERIIYAVEECVATYSNIECLIVGDGPEREYLNSLIAKKGLKNNIKIVGYQDNPYKYIKNADLYVCSSKSEGYSTTVVEALVLGVPVLTTDVSGMKEIFGQVKCGLIVPNSNEGVKKGLLSILSNPEELKTMKLNAIKRGDVFNTHSQIKEFIEILEN